MTKKHGSFTKENPDGYSLWQSPFFLVAASLPALLAIFGSRWFSKIEVGTVYVLDVALLFSSVLILVALLTNPLFDRFDLILTGAFLPLPVFAMARMPWAELSREAFLDLYPYFGLIHGLLIALAVRRSGPLSREALSTAVFVALWAHFAWVQLKAHDLISSEAFPESFFQLRHDLDGALIGVLAGAVFLRSTRQALVGRWLGFVISLLIIVAAGTLSSSRSVLVATTIVILSVSVNEGFRRKEEGWWSFFQVVMAGVVLLCLALSLVFSINTQVTAKFADAIRVVNEEVSGENQSSPVEIRPHRSQQDSSEKATRDTTGARWNAWEAVINFTFDSPSKTLLGSGPGSDYLLKSGAAEKLLDVQGSKEPDASRHPHNVAIHTLGLLGLPATLFLCGLVATALLVSFRRNMHEVDPLGELALLLLLALGSAALLGVIFEGPYGAVPISWGLGILTGLAVPKTLIVK